MRDVIRFLFKLILCVLLALAAGFALSGRAIGRPGLHVLRMDEPGPVSTI